MDTFKELAKERGLKITRIQEVSIPGRKFPDIEVIIDHQSIIIPVKIDSEQKLIDDVVYAYDITRKVGASGVIALLFPRNVRDIHPELLEHVGSKLEVSRAVILTPWLSSSLEHITIRELVEQSLNKYLDYLKTLKPIISYDTIVETAREVVEDLAVALRKHMGIKKYSDMAMGIVGRFDIYKAMLEEFNVSEQEMRAWIADIMAYLLVNQILFTHIVAKKIFRSRLLPHIDNLLSPPEDLIKQLKEVFNRVSSDYPKILGSASYICNILLRINDPRVNLAISRFIYVLEPLRPEDVGEELLGRLYHESIPSETRKNLGAFYTKPEAAKLLANLAIDKWNVKVLDPACGSGTILVECYHRMRKLSPPMSPDKLHRKLLSQIYGVDIMHFAFHMSSINLAAQNMFVRVDPNVMPGDGITAMLHAQTKGNPHKTLFEWMEGISKEKIPKDFDLVIMNPPFTRRERIPNDERKRLKNVIKEVKGKTGYWAYFVVAADNVLKDKGKMALVAPEGFFDQSGWSVREFLFNKDYNIEFIVKSSLEFFSEQAAFRDYLVVLGKKGRKRDPVIVVLKKKLRDVNIEKIASEVKDFATSSLDKKENEEFLILRQPREIIRKYVRNLKPLVAFSTVEGYEIFSELIKTLKDLPTLRNLGANIFAYNPGQYVKEADTIYTRKLFVSRYESRAPSLMFWIDGDRGDSIILRTRGGRKFAISKSKDQVVCSLRTYAGVKHMDITGEEEYAIISPNIPKDVKKMVGLTDENKLKEACKDIKGAYRDHAGNILLDRKVRLNKIYYLAYYSENKCIGITSAMLNMDINLPNELRKVLVLYLNSTFNLIQLLALLSEVEGAWVTLHEEPIWALVHVPDLENLDKRIVKQANEVFKEIRKLDVMPLQQRIREGDIVQRKIDKMAMEMIGIDWKHRLEELYNVVSKELAILSKVSAKT